MIFRQLFDRDTYTYTYILGCEETRETVIIDPVRINVQQYLKLLKKLDLNLVAAIDTHIHADHVTAAGILRENTDCDTIIGNESDATCTTKRVSDGDIIKFGEFELKAMYTLGHTSDSYSFVMPDRVFTGDTLLIRGSGRTDFQNGNSYSAYHSITQKLLKLPLGTVVYPGHDYNGNTSSTIGEEIQHNPRLKVKSADEYANLMDSLKLAPPNYMDIAVPANLLCGLKP